jgi:hypothetical protein
MGGEPGKPDTLKLQKRFLGLEMLRSRFHSGLQPGRQEEWIMKIKKVETVKASGWIWGGGGG